jgi:hypothetical protein
MAGTRGATPNWPEEPISSVGRFAAFATLGCVMLTGVTYAIVAWMAFACTRGCVVRPALGGLVLLFAIAMCAVGVGLVLQVWRRPVDPAGGSGWTYGLSVIFALGVLGAITRIPDVTCGEGSHLSAFGYCSGLHDARIDPASWIWLKDLIALCGIAVAAAIVPRRRLAVITAPLAAAVWFVGTGIFLRTLL